jgi:hypothetical protein
MLDTWVDEVFKVLKEIWKGIAFIVFVYIVWKLNLEKAVLAVAGTVFLGWAAFKMWVHYVQQDFISGIDFVLLEIIPPREVLRSPKAMELFLTNALYHWSLKGGQEEYWQGAVWLWFSLEIASIDGQVHFYIRTPTRVRGLIETQMYAQYPQAQVRAVEDYTLAVDEISPSSAWEGWGCEFKLKKSEAYPIKTYVDFGLDKDPKEEFKVDPISPIIELFGSLQKGEQMWLQYVITPSKKTWKDSFFSSHDWIAESDVQIRKLLEPYTRHHPDVQQPAGVALELRPPSFLEDTVKAIKNKTTKLGFDTGIRAMYIAKKEAFSMNSRRNIRLIFRQFAAPHLNSLERHNNTAGDTYGGILMASAETVRVLTNRMLTEFRERAFFHPAMRHHLFNVHVISWATLARTVRAYLHPVTFVLNVEELATLWHFPGQILKVPTLERIESKEASPPPNLPV